MAGEFRRLTLELLYDDLAIKPLGNGADIAVFVPLSVFDGHGLTGTSQFWMEATQSNSNDGNDEWTLSDEGIDASYTPTLLNDSDAIGSSVIPEPGTAILLGIGLAGLGCCSRRRRP